VVLQEEDDAEVRPFASLFARIGSANGNAPAPKSSASKGRGGGGPRGEHKDGKDRRNSDPQKTRASSTKPTPPATVSPDDEVDPAKNATQPQPVPPQTSTKRSKRKELPHVPAFNENRERGDHQSEPGIDLDDEELSADDRDTVQRFQALIGEFKEMFPPSGDDAAFAQWLKAKIIQVFSSKFKQLRLRLSIPTQINCNLLTT